MNALFTCRYWLLKMSFLTANNKQDQDEYWPDKLIPAFENANSFPTADNKKDQVEC